TGAGKNLTFNAGNLGNVLVTGSIGTLAAKIGQLLIQNLNDFTLNGNLFANSVLQQDGQGTTWFQGDMTTDGAAGIELHGNNLTIGTTPHVQKVKTTNGGAFTAEHIPGVTGTLIINSDMDLDGGFFDLGTGPTILNGNIVTGLGGDVVFAGDLLLTDDLTTINSGGDITFGTLPGLGNVDGEADLADEDLTLTALGDINFNGEVGGNIVPGSQPRLGDLVITSAANVNAAKDMTVALLQQNAGSGTSTFNGKIDSTNGLNLTGNNFTFNDTVTTAAGGATIDNAGVLTMAEAADFTLTGGNFLQKSTAGTGTVQTAAEITTTSANDITMNSPTTLTGPVTLDSGRDINLNGSVNGAQDLTLTAGRDINTQAIGQGARIGNLVVTTVRNWLASGAIKAASIDQQAGTGTTTFNGALDTNTLAGIDLDGTAFNVNAPVNTTAGGTFTVTNAGDLNIGPNGDMTLDGAFLQDGAGNVKTAGDITTTADKIEFDAPVELTGNVAMDSNNGEIRFKDKLNGAFNLTLAADLGNIVMEQSLGGSIRLAALLIQTVVNWTANDSIFAQSITQLAGTGTSSFFGNVDTNGAAGIDLTGNNFFFGPASAVNATNLGDVDVRATLNDTSRVDMNGPVTTDGGDVTILANDDVTMAAAADVTSNGGDVVIRADQNGNGIGQLSMAYGPLDQTVVDSGAGKTTLRSGEDLLLGRVISTNAADDAVTLRSSHGKIVDGGEAQPFDVDAPNGGLVASARDGIGNASDPNGALETNVRRIDATTVSGDINFDVTSTQPLVVANATVTGGTGNIEINQLAPFSMTVQNASTVNGSITFTSIVDLIVTGNIFSGGPLGGVSLVADSNLDASGDLTIQSTSLVNAGVGLLNLYAGNNVNLLGQAITTGVAVINAGGNLLVNLLQSNHFFVNVMHDIVDVNLDGPNFVANDSSIMNAGGVIGRFKDAIDVFLSFGNLTATAQGVGAEGVSINLQGRIPDTLIFNLTPGLVLFNNIAEGGSPIQLFTTGLSSTFNLVASQPLVDNFSELQTRKGLEVGYGLTKDREKPFVPSLDLSSLEKMVRVLVSPQERKKWTGKVRPVAPTPTPVPTVPAVTPAPVVPPVTQLPQVPVLPTAPAPSPAPVYEALKPAPQPTPMPMVPPITPFPASEQARPAAPQPKPGPGLVQPTVPSGPALTPPPAGRLFQQSIEEETLEPGIPATQLMGAKPASGSPLGQYDVEETKTTEKK
ncbi:MAG TPA: hypothetical protein VL404_05195, partial [Candidatus Eisenbacteria bacterium]|nr:hypothetical protein [Candidatus Eisenbacteria bacterium]